MCHTSCVMKQTEYGEREDGSRVSSQTGGTGRHLSAAAMKALTSGPQLRISDEVFAHSERKLGRSCGRKGQYSDRSQHCGTDLEPHHREQRSRGHEDSGASDSHRCSLFEQNDGTAGQRRVPLRAVEESLGNLQLARLEEVQALSSGETELQGIVDGLARRIRAKQ